MMDKSERDELQRLARDWLDMCTRYAQDNRLARGVLDLLADLAAAERDHAGTVEELARYEAVVQATMGWRACFRPRKHGGSEAKACAHLVNVIDALHDRLLKGDA